MKLPGIAAIVLAAGLAASPAFAYSGSWYVVENLDSRTCYRVAHFTPAKGWRDFGRFNTFREAGLFIWSHRGVCRDSPVFG